MNSKIWFITGTSSGFGLLLALAALAAKHRVIGTVRSKTKSAEAVRQIAQAGGEVVELDMVDSQKAIIATVQAAEKIYGQIDVLVNNAGYAILGAVEQFSEEEVKSQYQTNVHGPLFAMQAVLPGMRARRQGCIVNISSSVAQVAGAACGVYGSSKFALEGLTEAFAAEVQEFGIDVLLVEPDVFRTNSLNDGVRQAPAAPLPEDYKDAAVGKLLDFMPTLAGAQPGDPRKAVARIFEVVTGEGHAGHLKGKVQRLLLGMSAVAAAEAKQKSVVSDAAEARKLEEQESTAFPS